MTAGKSDTSLVNEALAELGTTRRILTLDDNKPLARTAKPLFAPTRDEVLADHPWNESVRRETLPPAIGPEVPDTRYSYAYLLPADCIRWLPWDEADPDYFDGEQEGRYLLTNAGPAVVARFIFRNTKIATWSTGFETAFVKKIGAKMAKAVTGQDSERVRMLGLYDDELTKAKRQDGLATGQRKRRTVRRSRWLEARLGGRGYP